MTDVRFTPEQKREIVLQLLAGRVSMAELCRQNQVTSTAIYNWRDRFLEAGLVGLHGKRLSGRERQLVAENEKLRKVIGDIAVANHLLKGGTTVSRGNGGGRR